MIDAAVRTLFLNGRIMVLCFGRVAESGDIDTVIAKPAHPYTQQLLKSVPSIDPERRWTDKVDIRTVERPRTHESGKCVFVERCPFRMPACSRRRPPSAALLRTKSL